MKQYLVKVKFNSPYMQHRMDDLKLEQWEKMRGPIIDNSMAASPDIVKAEYHSYVEDGKYFIPSAQFKGAFIEAGKLVKGKVGNATKSMKNIVAGMFLVGPEHIAIPKWDITDKRSAVNRAVKARVMTIRPRWNAGLEVEFNLIVKNDSIPVETVRSIIEYAGSYIGVGSFRPTNNGEFGCYDLVSLTPVINQ